MPAGDQDAEDQCGTQGGATRLQARYRVAPPASHASEQADDTGLSFGDRQNDQRREERPERCDGYRQEAESVEGPGPPRQQERENREPDERMSTYAQLHGHDEFPSGSKSVVAWARFI